MYMCYRQLDNSLKRDSILKDSFIPALQCNIVGTQWNPTTKSQGGQSESGQTDVAVQHFTVSGTCTYCCPFVPFLTTLCSCGCWMVIPAISCVGGSAGLCRVWGARICWGCCASKLPRPTGLGSGLTVEMHIIQTLLLGAHKPNWIGQSPPFGSWESANLWGCNYWL